MEYQANKRLVELLEEHFLYNDNLSLKDFQYFLKESEEEN